MMNRRHVLKLAMGAACLATPAVANAVSGLTSRRASAPLDPAWAAWKAAFLSPEGRVIDELQASASHSEGQGYGLTLAAAFEDVEAFSKIASWTEANLATARTDGLLAWRWLPNSQNPVPDPNNASDGDLFYAWGMLKGAKIFNKPAYRNRAIQITKALGNHCVATDPANVSQSMLLPGAMGFSRTAGLIVNPSYIMPLAMRELALASGDIRLAQAALAGIALMEDVSKSRLPPDWLELSASGWGPAANMSFGTGYDALRIPLYLLWSGANAPETLQRFGKAYAAAAVATGGGKIPTVFDVDGKIQTASVDPGYRAITGLLQCHLSNQIGATIPPFVANQPYYPATLHLMTLIAQVQSYPKCFPL